MTRFIIRLFRPLTNSHLTVEYEAAEVHLAANEAALAYPDWVAVEAMPKAAVPWVSERFEP